jgi:sporulation protein YlmC with PRC-barrel domain
MLRTLKELTSYTIGASDGDVGHVKDVYFDDEDWVIRYLVVETGSWLSSRKVLISPYSIGNADWVAHRLPARISKEQVKNSPDIDTEKPVSRQHEIQYADYYSYPYYWDGSGYWGDGLYAPTMGESRALGTAGDASRAAVQQEVADVYARAEHARHEQDDPHLRSSEAVVGYHVQASDGDIGHVSGMLVDEESWAIRYLVVDTSNWWMGHQVLVTPQWITAVDWYESKVHVNLTRKSIQGAPVFDSSFALNRQHELDLYRYYERPNYWEHEKQRELALV